MKNLCTLIGITAITLTASAQCSLFNDGFETGTYSPNWTVVSQSAAVTTTSPNSGSYRLEITGGNMSHLDGVYHSMTASTPSQISWWIYPQGNVSTNYFVAGNSSVSGTNCIVFCYWIGSSSSIRFVSASNIDIPETANQWYHIELRNINWSAHTFDIYINNTLQSTAYPFRSSTQNDLSTIHLYNYSSGVGAYDDIVIGNPSPSVTSTFTSPLCNGNSNGAVDLSVTGGTSPYTYAWSNSATSQDLSSITAGTYSVTVSDAGGCTTTHTVVVTEPSVLSVTTTQTDVLCFGAANGSATASVSGGTPTYTYMWNPPGGTSPTASNLVAGAYTCTVTDANGCTATQSVNITQPSQLLTAAANNGNLCPGDTATLTGTANGGTPGYTYDWMPGNMSGSVVTDTPGSSTTYTLQVTDANGCTSTSTTTVTVYTAPVVSLGSDFSSCGSTTLDAGNAGSMYLWSDGSTTQIFNVTASGQYEVWVTDGNGCSAGDSIFVTVDSIPVVVGSASMNFVCTGEPTVILFGSPAGGTWSGTAVYGATFEPDTAGPGVYDLYYAYMDSLGCTGEDTVQITVDLCLGLNAVDNTQMSVVPNPTSGVISIVLNQSVTDAQIVVTDVQGREVYTSVSEQFTAGTPGTIDLSAMSEGIYFVKVIGADCSYVERIVISR